MPKICAAVSAVPPHRVSQSGAKDFARTIFGKSRLDVGRLLSVFDNAGIHSRYFSCPLDWFTEDHTLEEKNRIYIESATDLTEQASRRLFEKTGTSPEQIDYIMYVNTTGLATPSIDARLINKLGLRRDIRRTPVWGLGCAGGAAGISHAYHYLLGHPKDRVLLTSAEMCGLTFIPNDLSKSNLVASALFGEGAAAVLLAGDDVSAEGVEILDTASRFYPDSLDVMGWNVVSRGLQVVFAQRIPDIVEANSRADLDEFLGRHRMTLSDIDRFIFHPGGIKVVEAYETALGLGDGQLRQSREILREYGNMSSVTVLFVLERCLAEAEKGNLIGKFGLISALGPGFCSESALVRF
ncbi:MAG TPA: 3-oxoacyl-[acyl-carrier-protein] synthase III C-terminal domain-containing protein [candidate division Zixibacteria bacterium]|nr:3-oxoacyl-[acyl-carrier-protein] synthase III C-terminal domain-containing protein [candidate division Zixibacteria bacterium]